MVDSSPHEAAVHNVQSLPVTVPGKPVGRDEALRTIYASLKAGQAMLIYGAPGMGKTTLAATLASAYAQQPGGVLWLNVHNSTLEELLVRVGRAYEVPEVTTTQTPIAMIGAVASTLKQHKPLVVLDGEIDDPVAHNFIAKCAAGLPALLVCEERIQGSWSDLELTRLDPDSAVIMFKQQSAISANTADHEIAKIVQLLGYGPFAIAVAGRAMVATKQTPADFLQALQQTVTAAGGDGQLAALTLSYRALNGALQGLILMMGAFFTGASSAELLSMVSGAALESIQQAMNVLAQLHLVDRTQRYGMPYYRLHSITRDFALNFLRSSNRLEGLQEKVRESTLAYARQHSSDSAEAYDRLATEMENFIAVAMWASDSGERSVANQLVVALTQAGDFIHERGYVYELLRLRGLGTSDKVAFPAYDDEPALMRDVTSVDEFDDDRFDDDFEDEFDEEDEDEGYDEEEEDSQEIEADELAHLRSELSQARQQADIDRQVEVLKSIGKLQVEQKMENEAIATYGEALNLYEATENATGILEMLDMLSALMAKTENLQAAVLHASRGIKLAEEAGDQDTKMHLLITLGDARQQLGESEEADDAFSAALEIARNTNDSQNEALVLYKLGYAQLDNGEARTAIDTWEQALRLFREQQKRDYEGRTLGALGTAYGELELWAEATNFYTSALHIAREVGDSEEEALQLGNLGYAAVQAQELGQAVLRYRQALHLHYRSRNRENIISTIVDLARLLAESARHLSVAELLIDDALRLDANDKDVKQLKERISNEKMLAAANGVQFVDVTGTAQDYASNAYRLLES